MNVSLSWFKALQSWFLFTEVKNIVYTAYEYLVKAFGFLQMSYCAL